MSLVEVASFPGKKPRFLFSSNNCKNIYLACSCSVLPALASGSSVLAGGQQAGSQSVLFSGIVLELLCGFRGCALVLEKTHQVAVEQNMWRTQLVQSACVFKVI